MTFKNGGHCVKALRCHQGIYFVLELQKCTCTQVHYEVQYLVLEDKYIASTFRFVKKINIIITFPVYLVRYFKEYKFKNNSIVECKTNLVYQSKALSHILVLGELYIVSSILNYTSGEPSR